MMRRVFEMRRQLKNIRHTRPRREMTHGELITRMIDQKGVGFNDLPIFVETGSGISTVALALGARQLNGIIYSCDYNEEKVLHLRHLTGAETAGVRFRIGESCESLREIVDRHDYLDLVFLDSAASAMHTFREFSIVEHRFHPGAVLIVDNAALPGERHALGPVRKGKILVPYLLASPLWEVIGFPTAGDSMIVAFRHENPQYSDPNYEYSGHIDNWKESFTRKLTTSVGRGQTGSCPWRRSPTKPSLDPTTA